MANQPELDQWDSGVYQLEQTDPVLAGLGGVANKPLLNLANRTKYLYQRVAEITGTAKGYAAAGGTANAITASYTPVIAALSDGMVLRFKGAASNTGATTFTPNSGTIAASPVYGYDHQPLSGGEIVLSGECEVQWDVALNGGAGAWVLVRNSGGLKRVITPAQFDNSAAIANMSAVQRALGNFASGTLLSAGVTTNLTAAQAGQAFGVQGGTINLPAVSSVPVGASYAFYFSIATTINALGSDRILFGGVGAASPVFRAGDSLVIAAIAPNVWGVISGGLSDFAHSNMFGASLGTSGYVKHPSGEISQWGSFSVPANVQSVTTNFPLAFPNNAYAVVATRSIAGNPAASDLCSTAVVSNSQFSLYKAGSVASVCSYTFMATGN